MKKLMKQGVCLLMALLTVHASFPLEASYQMEASQGGEVRLNIDSIASTPTAGQANSMHASPQNVNSEQPSAAPPSPDEILVTTLESLRERGAEFGQPNEVPLPSNEIGIQTEPDQENQENMNRNTPGCFDDYLRCSWKVWIFLEHFFEVAAMIAVTGVNATALLSDSSAFLLTIFLFLGFKGVSLDGIQSSLQFGNRIIGGLAEVFIMWKLWSRIFRNKRQARLQEVTSGRPVRSDQSEEQPE